MKSFEEFKEFNWHDCPMYSIRFDDELEFNIDYIVDTRLISESKYEYLIAPALLIFYSIENFEINVNADFLNGLEINRIDKNDNSFIIELQEGYIKFNSIGFKQSFLKPPLWVKNLYLSNDERSVK